MGKMRNPKPKVKRVSKVMWLRTRNEHGQPKIESIASTMQSLKCTASCTIVIKIKNEYIQLGIPSSTSWCLPANTPKKRGNVAKRKLVNQKRMLPNVVYVCRIYGQLLHEL